MRKSAGFWWSIFVIGALSFAFSGCRSKTPAGVETKPASETANTQPADKAGPASLDKGDLKLQYQTPKNNVSKTHTVGSNPQAITKVISDLNQRLILPFDMVVSFEDCGEPDAFYEPTTHQITLCHQLIDEYYDLFAGRIKDKTKLDDAVKAAIAATFFHELGHGLVDAWKIPITGREEDAVDQLSTLVLINTTEDGESMALAGALMFKLYANLTKGEKKFYWDEHSLDEQRFYDTICMVYGHDEKKYAYLVQNGTLPDERAVLCADEYERISSSWRQLLAPYLKPPEQARPKLKLR